MDLKEYFNNNKNNRIISYPSYSLKLSKNKKLPYLNNNINKEIYKNVLSNNLLPQIKYSSSLNINKRFYNKKFINNHNPDIIQKNSDRINFSNLPNSSFFQLNNNIISIKKPFFRNKIKAKFNFRNNQSNIGDNSSSIKSTINIKNNDNEIINKEKPKKENSLVGNEIQKQFVKTVNIYFKNNFKNNESIDDDNNIKKEENTIHKTKSMFMTGMDFLMPNNTKNKNKKCNKEKIINDKLNRENKEKKDNKENKEQKFNYDYLSFKELLKHIEENKKKIIDNQNDIEDMILTAKDTHKEIWKCNHCQK
jgi:hypothetical protein